MEYKTIVDANGNIVDLCVMFVDGQPQYFKIKEGQKEVDLYKGSYVKPHWNGSAWEEGATEEEIIAAEQEKNKTHEETITTTDRIDELEASLAELSMTLAQKGVL